MGFLDWNNNHFQEFIWGLVNMILPISFISLNEGFTSKKREKWKKKLNEQMMNVIKSDSIWFPSFKLTSKGTPIDHHHPSLSKTGLSYQKAALNWNECQFSTISPLLLLHSSLDDNFSDSNSHTIAQEGNAVFGSPRNVLKEVQLLPLDRPSSAFSWAELFIACKGEFANKRVRQP